MPKLNKQQIMTASALAGALAFAFALGLYAFRGAIFAPSEPEPVVPPPEADGSGLFRHPLTGEKSETVVPPPAVYAVMIDHSADAWPQSGVNDAFLVIEAPVEAGIPRLELFFMDEQEVPVIGPVRSARPYFVDWANELDAMYVHVGGSPDALELIASNGTFDLNEYWNGTYFWRSADRFAPHNAYTSTDLLGKALKKAEEDGRAPLERIYGTWLFKDPAENAPEQGVDAQINFLGSTYRAQWVYAEGTNRYQRIQAGLPFVSRDGDKVYADNVAVVVTEMEVLDSVGRRSLRTTGEGTAYVFQDGGVVEGTWKKPSVSERLRFYDAEGKELAMNAGTTWIEMIEDEDDVHFSDQAPTQE